MGKLAAALDSQLASDNPQALGSPVRIGLTFVGGGGGYCRTFSAVRADSLSGIACRRDGEWRLRMRSEEHTSELQSLMRISYAVFCLKKKKETEQHIEQQSICKYNNIKRNNKNLLPT